MVKMVKSAPPAAFVAGLGTKDTHKSKKEGSVSRVLAAMSALEKVKANSQAGKVDRRTSNGSKPSKKEWWMRYEPPPSGVCLINLNEETPWHSLIEA